MGPAIGDSRGGPCRGSVNLAPSKAAAKCWIEICDLSRFFQARFHASPFPFPCIPPPTAEHEPPVSSFRSSAILFRSNNRCNGFFFFFCYYYYYYYYRYYSLGRWAVAALERGQSKARLQIKCIFHAHTHQSPPSESRRESREILIVHGAQTRYDIVHATQIDFLI